MISLPTLLFLASVVRSVTADCYAPDGSLRSKKNGNNFQPCGGGTSMCCNVAFGDVCQPNGLCYNKGAKLYWRESCTDPTWESPGCLRLCLDWKMDGDATVTECEDGSFCCGNGDSAKKCCKEGTGSFIVDGKVVSAVSSEPSEAPAAPESSGKPGASGTGSSEDDGNDDESSSPPSSSASDEDADSDSNNDSSDSTSRPKSKPDSDAESASSESSSDSDAASGGSSGSESGSGSSVSGSGSDSSSPEASSKSTNVGAIAGGVVGGVAGLALIGLAFILFRRRRRAAERGVIMSDDPHAKAAEADGAEIPVEIYTPGPMYELQGCPPGR